jgi:hypothetical protein
MKERSEMTIAELIVDAGWWLGTEAEWRALPLEQREEIAFIRTGCRIAYPTWERPVDCVHTECQIRRGELPKIALTNRILLSEASTGWLRFMREENRGRLAKVFRAYRKAARETGVYDPWKIGWQLMVYSAVQPY